MPSGVRRTTNASVEFTAYVPTYASSVAASSGTTGGNVPPACGAAVGSTAGAVIPGRTNAIVLPSWFNTIALTLPCASRVKSSCASTTW